MHSGLQRLAVTGLGETLTVMLAWVGATGVDAVSPQDTAKKRVPMAPAAARPREATIP